MATVVVCDKCGANEGVEKIDWEVAGRKGTIDLCPSCHTKALEALTVGAVHPRPGSPTRPTVKKAAPKKVTVKTKPKPKKNAVTPTAEIREWAKKQGLKVPDKGRVPTEIIQKFNARNRQAPGLDEI